MLLLVLFEYLLIVGVAVFAVTQIFIPWFRGTPFFPFFGTEAKLERELTRARGDLHTAQLRKELNDIRESTETVVPTPGNDPEPHQRQNAGH